MHLEATAVDLGGKLTSGKPYWRDFGAKFGHFVGDVEAKTGCGIGHVEARCQILFGLPKCSPPETPRFLSDLASYVLSIWGSSARTKATFWAQIGAKFSLYIGSWGILIK